MSDSNTLTRRDFILKALLFTGGGLAAGGGAAYAKGRWDASQAVAQAQSADLQAQASNLEEQAALLQQSLSASQASVAEFQAQLGTALTKNAELQNALTEKKTEVDTVNLSLAEAQTKIANLQELVGMFDRLEAGDFDALLLNGLAAAATGFAGLLGLSGLVGDGIRIGRALFDSFEQKFPDYRAGIDWLKAQIDSLNARINAVETAIGQAISSLDPLTSRMRQLVAYILDHLPFGIGQSVTNALTAIDDLYGFLPDTITGSQQKIVDKLSEPFGTNEKSLSRALLQPVREKTFTASEKLVVHSKALSETYLHQLQDPTLTAIDARTEVWKEIKTFREANQL